jgi:uncharacterized protein
VNAAMNGCSQNIIPCIIKSKSAKCLQMYANEVFLDFLFIMTASTIVGLLVVGLLAGVLSSMVGIGGGIVVVPALVFFFGISQKMAQGTSLAMLLPPIGILAVMNYYKQNLIDFRLAGILIVSFVAGGYLGSMLALKLDDVILKRVFGVFLLIVAAKYLLTPGK